MLADEWSTPEKNWEWVVFSHYQALELEYQTGILAEYEAAGEIPSKEDLEEPFMRWLVDPFDNPRLNAICAVKLLIVHALGNGFVSGKTWQEAVAPTPNLTVPSYGYTPINRSLLALF